MNIGGAGKSAEDSFSAKKHVVREGGVEPPPHFWDTDLNRARLPIPPLARALKGYGAVAGASNDVRGSEAGDSSRFREFQAGYPVARGRAREEERAETAKGCASARGRGRCRPRERGVEPPPLIGSRSASGNGSSPGPGAGSQGWDVG